MQALIQFFHHQLVTHEFHPVTLISTILDLTLIIFNVIIMNTLITGLTRAEEGSDAWNDGDLHKQRLLYFGTDTLSQLLINVLSVMAIFQFYLILVRIKDFYKKRAYEAVTKRDPSCTNQFVRYTELAIEFIMMCARLYVVYVSGYIYLTNNQYLTLVKSFGADHLYQVPDYQQCKEYVFNADYLNTEKVNGATGNPYSPGSEVFLEWTDADGKAACEYVLSFFWVEDFAWYTRLILSLNIFYTIGKITKQMTLIWEKASEFNDLIDEVQTSLTPFMVFLVTYMFMLILTFYMFGQQ